MDAGSVLSKDDQRIERAGRAAIDAAISPSEVNRMREFGTAVVAELELGGGPLVGIRVDMDGLPIPEATGDEHAPASGGFRSTLEGEMHACGHDGHVAMALGVATALARRRELLRGTVRLIVQPAEEGALGGAAAIAATGAADDLDAIVCCHLGLGIPSGSFVARGVLMGTTKLRVTYEGHPSHPVLAPHEGHNALLAGASAALAMHAIAPHPRGWFNLNVGVLRSGESQGVSPSQAVLELGVWASSTEVQEYVRERVREVAVGVAATWNVAVEMEHIGEAPLAEQSETLGALAADVARSVPGIEHVLDTVEIAAADDATLLIEQVRRHGGRGIYGVIGSDLADGHHTSHFDFDEKSLVHGTCILAGVVGRLLDATDDHTD